MKLNAAARLLAVEKSGPTKAMIETLDEWQNTSPASYGKKLKTQPWPEQFRKCSDKLYRIIVVSEATALKMFAQGHVDNPKPASWTKDMKVIKEFTQSLFFGDSYQASGEYPTVLLMTHVPKANEVILDIDRLWKDKSFKAWVEHYEDAGDLRGGEGLDFADSQKEVVLDGGIKVPLNNVQVGPHWGKPFQFISPAAYTQQYEKHR